MSSRRSGRKTGADEDDDDRAAMPPPRRAASPVPAPPAASAAAEGESLATESDEAIKQRAKLELADAQGPQDEKLVGMGTPMDDEDDVELQKQPSVEDEVSALGSVGASVNLSVATPLEASLAPSNEELEERVAQRIQQQIAKQVEMDIQRRLEQENQHQQATIVAAVEAIPEKEEISSEADDKDSVWYKKKWVWVGIIVLLLIIIGVVVGVVVGTSGGGGDSSSTNKSLPGDGDPTMAPASPTPAPTPVPTSQKNTPVPTAEVTEARLFTTLLVIIVPLIQAQLPDYDVSVLMDPSTAQFTALDWMSRTDVFFSVGQRKLINDPTTDVEPEEVLERWLAAFVYFHYGGDTEWNFLLRFLSASHICAWNANGAPNDGSPVQRGIFCDLDSRVTKLDLGNNGLYGRMPVELVLFSRLETLDFDGNPNHFGPIPVELTRFPALKEFWVRDNSLSGGILSEFGSMPNLISLDLAQNFFEGSVPPELADATGLQFLLIFENPGVNGTLPTELGTLDELILMNIEETSINGNIPTEYGNLGSLTSLSLGLNQLEGPIPTELGRLLNLELLDVSQNNLSGNLPSELGRLVGLRQLSVWANQMLSGPIPVQLANLQNLEFFYIDDTALTGNLNELFCNNPSSITFWSDVWADCRDNIEVVCRCCTHCCFSTGDQCVQNN